MKKTKKAAAPAAEAINRQYTALCAQMGHRLIEEMRKHPLVATVLEFAVKVDRLNEAMNAYQAAREPKGEGEGEAG